VFLKEVMKCGLGMDVGTLGRGIMDIGCLMGILWRIRLSLGSHAQGKRDSYA
jgi:hypothetical protein